MSGKASELVVDLDAASLQTSDRTRLRTEVGQGRVFVVRDALQALGLLAELRAATIEGARRVAGPAAAERLEAEGFEHVHDVVPGADIPDVMRAATAAHAAIAPALAKRICRFLLGAGHLYLEEPPNVRFHVPYDATRSIEDLGSPEFSGRITPHGPHHDSWYHCPTNGVDVWMALGPVTRGNGLSIYPEAEGRILPCDDRGVVRRDQSFGPPVNFEMDPGDILVFAGEHLHSSEINSTSLTRHVVSYRISLDRPRFVGNSPYRHRYRYLAASDGRAGALTERAWVLIGRARRSVDRRLGRANTTRWVVSAAEVDGFDAMPARHGLVEDVDDLLADDEASAAQVAARLELEPGSVRAVSEKLCAARTEGGDVVVFQRSCPHQGADLASGYVEGSTLYCPWHNLPIDLGTGASPCRTLRHIGIERRWSSEVADRAR